MKTHAYYELSRVDLEQKLWQKELEIIAEDNDFLLGLLASLQTEQVVTHKYAEKTTLFFNHFQYFYHQTKHLKAGLETMRKQSFLKGKIKKEGFREEIDCLTQKFTIFKNNFRLFLDTLTNYNHKFTHYL